MFDIDFYQLSNGEKPVEKFIDNLDEKMQLKALASIEILAEYGNNIRKPHSKSLGKGLFELRIRFANDITRIFYFFVANNRIILTNGFIKKSQKIPLNEIILARKYKADFERRFGKNE
ncbi:MAG: type II toxin-antitoxin system RelE/ParE family toxin [Lachnospiraceae bacterium]|nr:type II toxin-antitoxin system RelE/ParE family toxin [Lachnospiraceae bacterium]